MHLEFEMNIIKTKELTQSYIEKINNIVKSQDEVKHLPLYFDFSDDRCTYYLCFENEELMSVIALFEIDIDTYEAIAYTDMSNRCKGYFKAAYTYLCNDLEGECDISFICERNYSPAIKTAKSLSLTYECTETMMELDLSSYNAEPVFDIDIVKEDDIYYIFQSDIEIGSFCFYTFTFNTDDIYFHSFNIYEEYRNKGLGKLSMSAILYYLKSLGKTKIHLQLLLENTPAYKIYKELGFIITSEISYYKKIID